MKTIVALPGEGIGIEVVEATCELLAAASVPVKILTPPQITAPGSPVPEETKRLCREADAVLFGAAGPATTRVVGWLRWEMDAWGGVRPAKFYAGMRSPLADPDGIDLVVIRENSEGMYPGREGNLAELARALPDLRDRFGRALRELRRQRLGVLRVGARLGARHRGPRHRQPDGHAAVGRPHARASRARVGGGAPGGGRRARLSRRQDAHAGSARDGDHDTDGGGRARRVSQPMTPAARALAVLVALVLLGATTAAAQPSGTVTFGAHVTLATRWVDPADTDAEITPFMIFYALHDALVKPMPGRLNTPSLAESWTMSPDGKTWEFNLRKGTRFHNGDPVTAEDVKFSFERYKGAASAILKDRVREVQVVDPGRVRFHLKEPWPDFMTFYGTSASGAAWIVPKKYVEKVGDDGYKKAPVGA